MTYGLGGEMVDTRDSKSRAERRGGSNPLQGNALSLFKERFHCIPNLCYTSHRDVMRVVLYRLWDTPLLFLPMLHYIKVATDYGSQHTCIYCYRAIDFDPNFIFNHLVCKDRESGWLSLSSLLI